VNKTKYNDLNIPFKEAFYSKIKTLKIVETDPQMQLSLLSPVLLHNISHPIMAHIYKLRPNFYVF
jgi:hypothetical protein